jgi:hypothetical protein
MTYFLWHTTHILLVKLILKVRHKCEVALYIEEVLENIVHA